MLQILSISITSEPGEIVENSNEEAESASHDFGHSLRVCTHASKFRVFTHAPCVRAKTKLKF